MTRSRTTSPSIAPSASACPLEEHDADVYADLLRALREELQDPPEFVLRSEEPLPAPDAGMAA